MHSYKDRPSGMTTYINEDLGWVSIQGWYGMPWAQRRYITLFIRNMYRLSDERQPELERKIREAILNHYRRSDTEGGFFWVCDWRTPHFGPCPFCREMEQRFKLRGAPYDYLMGVWFGSVTTDWGTVHDWHDPGSGLYGDHSFSHIQPCYSRVLSFEEANDPASMGIPPYGMMTGTGKTVDGLEGEIVRIVTEHEMEEDRLADIAAVSQIQTEAATRTTKGYDVSGVSDLGGV